MSARVAFTRESRISFLFAGVLRQLTERPTQLMTNRWEGLVPVPAQTNIVHYRYKFDFNYNAMGNPKADSALSREYTLRIIDKP